MTHHHLPPQMILPANLGALMLAFVSWISWLPTAMSLIASTMSIIVLGFQIFKIIKKSR